MTAERLIIFLKAPRPGFVKTRLARTMGAAPACAAYRRLVEALLDNLSALPHVELRHAPDDAEGEIQGWLRPSWVARAQGEGDLGRRLHSAFAEAFTNGAQQVAVIGSDCPAIRIDDIEQCWAKLRTYDVVLGPAADGGYWLMGLKQLHERLFTGIPWSSATVLTETLQRAEHAGLTTCLLRRLTDVDTEKDWQEFLAERD